MSRRRRIRRMDDSTAASVRGMQVIGSTSRAAEELVRNSIESDATRVVVEIRGEDAARGGGGMASLTVRDDGRGIDPDAMDRYVGEVCCSSSRRLTTAAGGGGGSSRQRGGESLRSIVSLSASARIETSYRLVGEDRDDGDGGTPMGTRDDTDRRKKRRRRRTPFAFGENDDGGEESPRGGRRESSSAPQRQVVVITSEKVFEDGEVVSFRASSSDDSGSAAPSAILPARSRREGGEGNGNGSGGGSSSGGRTATGTTVVIRGLFHRHAVRRKQHSTSSSFGGEGRGGRTRAMASEVARIRDCVRLLALCHPSVGFEVRIVGGDGGSKSAAAARGGGKAGGKVDGVDCSFEPPPRWGCAGGTRFFAPAPHARSLNAEASALASRLCEMHPDAFEGGRCVELASSSEEERQRARRGARSATNLRAFGVLCVILSHIPPSDVDGVCKDGDDDAPVHAARDREFETVAINGRLATDCAALCDVVSGEVGSYVRGSGGRAHFFIHVLCDDAQLVVKDAAATTSVPRADELTYFIRRMIARSAIADQHDDGRTVALRDVSNVVVARDGVAATRDKRWDVGGRFVKGEHAKAACSSDSNSPPLSGDDSNCQLKHPPSSSPFSSAFFDSEGPHADKMKPKSKAGSRAMSSAVNDSDLLLSFDDTFFDDGNKSTVEPPSDDYNFESGVEDMNATTATSWTKQRIRGLEGKIAALAMDANNASGGSGGKISLTKEMLVNAEVIAQVEDKFIIIKASGVLCAVDQHAADERIALEKLESALFNPAMHDETVIHMTHKSLLVSDVLKRSALNPPMKVRLTPKDMSAVKQHWSLLQKWKFSFQESSDDDTLLLTGLASVCGRLASIRDFMAFVKELGHFTGGEIKPKFVKNILASNACRYAIMFGDSLTHEQCVKLIQSLSKCEFCFVCAHGRPSVIPLINMRQRECEAIEDEGKCPASKESTKGYINYGPKRFIRRK